MNSNVKWKMQELQRSILDLTREAEQYEEELVKTTSKADEIGKLINNFQFSSRYLGSRDDSDDFSTSPPKSFETDFSDYSSESKYSSRKYTSKSFEPDDDLLDFDSKYSSSGSSSRYSSKSYDDEDSTSAGVSRYSSTSSSRVKRSDRLKARRRSRHDLTIV